MNAHDVFEAIYQPAEKALKEELRDWLAKEGCAVVEDLGAVTKVWSLTSNCFAPRFCTAEHIADHLVNRLGLGTSLTWGARRRMTYGILMHPAANAAAEHIRSRQLDPSQLLFERTGPNTGWLALPDDTREHVRVGGVPSRVELEPFEGGAFIRVWNAEGVELGVELIDS